MTKRLLTPYVVGAPKTPEAASVPSFVIRDKGKNEKKAEYIGNTTFFDKNG